MFRLSKAAEYSIRGLLHLALNHPEDKLCDIEEIAKATDTPPAYLAKLLQQLVKKGFVHSFKGQKGGFTLARHPKDISLLDVIEAMEGPIFLNYCLIYEGYCDRDKTCPVHDVWGGAQKVLVDYLSGCSFERLAADAKEKQSGVFR
ncbi:MAG: Rrf2 family transcriptional regulator [Nitrospirae bacterium]|nr:Rrf2 family transcriptional regulator [Nitrospirota bacterium]